MGSVIVAGSANVDTAVRVREHPRPGETVLGLPLGRGAGGKGLNQAIAAARAGARTRFAGAVGADADAATVRGALEAAGVELVIGSSEQPTGAAFVMVAPTGENAIVVVAGANADSAVLVERFAAAVAGSDSTDVVLAQLETPLEAVHEVLRAARSGGARTMLNAAPSQSLPQELLRQIDILVVNEHECADIAGPEYADTRQAARSLAEHVGTVVVTLGGNGALSVEGSNITHHAAHSVAVVDTTAAGDTFCGALAAQLALGDTLSEAIRFSTGAAALAVQRPGAADSIPLRSETMTFLDARSTHEEGVQ